MAQQTVITIELLSQDLCMITGIMMYLAGNFVPYVMKIMRSIPLHMMPIPMEQPVPLNMKSRDCCRCWCLIKMMVKTPNMQYFGQD